MFNCLGCGDQMVWQSDFNYDEWFALEEDEEVEGVVGVWRCFKCESEFIHVQK